MRKAVLAVFFACVCPPCSFYAYAGVPPAGTRDISVLDGYSWADAEIPGVPVPSSAGRGVSWGDYFTGLESMVTPGGLSAASSSRLELLVDGREVVESVVPDLERALSFIHIEIYKWSADSVGLGLRDLLALLTTKVRSGVRVRVVLDQLGSGLMLPNSSAHKFVRSMREAGIDVRIRGFELLHLDHRKVMVMDDGGDGIVAYTGGMNIGEDYQRNWHDQQTRVTGPAAEQLHGSFLDAWENATGEKLSGFPAPHDVPGGALVRVIKHVGGDADRNIKKAYLLAIASARRIIRIEDPYFTDKDVIRALIGAASDPGRPGLKVQLIVPAKNDVPVTLRGFRSHYKAMLNAGIEIYEYQPRMSHLKVAVMDHLWATVGSSNLDSMSMKYNDEMNLLVMDGGFAAELDERIFDRDIPDSLRITEYNFNLLDSISGVLPFRSVPGRPEDLPASRTAVPR